ncbi:thioesterase-like superfamily-domain-containing protein [Hypoxylon sp. FL1857]|nr:thioesterase-like superfamily-domain-containing protein [Hypoxylon sp. FL1857]
MRMITPVPQWLQYAEMREISVSHGPFSNSPPTSQEGLRFVFGGSLMGQSAAAAAATVTPTFQIYSLQSAFLRASKPGEKVYYRVERTSDGRAFASRIVRATQESSDTPFYVATVCFQRNDPPPGNVLDYHVPMPETDGVQPEDISKDKVQKLMAARITRSVPLLQLGAKEEPFDWRPFDNPFTPEPTDFRQRAFVRSPAFTSNSPHVHQSALAFLSDTYLMSTALNANPGKVGRKMSNFMMGASLTSNISLHEPMAKVDEWMLGERETSWGSHGRVVIHQRFWNVKSGRLVMSGTQECLIRLKDVNKL